MSNLMHSFIIESQNQLKIELEEKGVQKKLIQKALESGYICCDPLMGATPGVQISCVMDCYYGFKYSGIIRYDNFIDYLNGGRIQPFPSGVEKYTVKSIAEIEKILNLPRHKKYKKRMCFRGQIKENWLERAIPNPYALNLEGKERFIAPSFWRQCKDIHNPAIWSESGESIFRTIYAIPLIYGDLSKISNREFKERHKLHNTILPFSNEFPLLEQHYGMRTIGLDVTFDPKVAAFFATHKFNYNNDGTATYIPVKKGEHQGIVYSFVFEDPTVYQTSYLVKKIQAFQHLKPIRPLRQKCGLIAFHMNEINAAPRDLDAIFILDENFDMTEMPDTKFLFPNKVEDPFYGKLLEEKNRFKELKKEKNPWEEIVEYI